MKLEMIGIASDIQQMFSPIIDYMGEKLKITVSPCSFVENEPQRFHVVVETKNRAICRILFQDTFLPKGPCRLPRP